MFPFIRLVKELVIASRQPRLSSLTDSNTTYHRCWPHDLDAMAELNNGRTLTLYDLGRIALAYRIGLIATLRREGWAMTMAGSSARYRQRIRGFERFEMRSRAVSWDDKFVYIVQSMWKMDGTCASQVLYRAAVTDKNGLVRPPRILEAMGQQAEAPEPPEWVANWIKAEGSRPWPPQEL